MITLINNLLSQQRITKRIAKMAKMNQTTMVYEKLKEKIENGYYSPAESLPEI